MGRILKFQQQRTHVRTSSSSRAAKRANKSEVTPAALACSVDRTRVHHSEGILSRLNHLITAQLPAPTSAAMASRECQSSITARNEIGTESVMNECMGPSVPIVKAILSHDTTHGAGHCVPMAEDAEIIAESEWREGFRQRIRQAQGGRTQETMARLLGVSRDAYAKYVGGRKSVMPVRLLPKFCEICDVRLEWLIEGNRIEKGTKVAKPSQKPRRVAAR
jgi:DNA-binding transcriptional regulator YdaS (Cro superfamily)